MNIKIISDSTCDLPEEVLEKYNITMMPLSVIKDGKNYTDGIDITPADIFEHVANGGSLCTTAALNIGEYEEQFAKYSKEYDGVIHINISAEFSSCHQNARLAAEKAERERIAAEQAKAAEAARLAAEHAAHIAAINKEHSQNVFFTIGSAYINKKESAKIKKLAEWLKANEQYTVDIVGYADAVTGTPKINNELSKRRAENVRKTLIANGVAENRIIADHKGDTVQPFEKAEQNRVVICTLE